MKKLFLILLIALSNEIFAQDIFQKHLYSPELALKYREEAGLSLEQVEKIKSIYSNDLSTYNNKKWDLDASIAALEKLISQSTIDAKAANAQLEKSLALETEIKKIKLDILVKVKNTLTPAQQAKLNTHKDEPIESSIIAPLNETQRMELKIRGAGTSTGPLYIAIDHTGKTTEIESPKDIDLHPDDIQSIEVLKGEKAIAAYGKRGANGVVIITIKKK